MTRKEMMDYLGLEEEKDSSIVDTAMRLFEKYGLDEYGLSLDGCIDDMPYVLENEGVVEVTRENGIVVYQKIARCD